MSSYSYDCMFHSGKQYLAALWLDQTMCDVLMSVCIKGRDFQLQHAHDVPLHHAANMLSAWNEVQGVCNNARSRGYAPNLSSRPMNSSAEQCSSNQCLLQCAMLQPQ